MSLAEVSASSSDSRTEQALGAQANQQQLCLDKVRTSRQSSLSSQMRQLDLRHEQRYASTFGSRCLGAANAASTLFASNTSDMPAFRNLIGDDVQPDTS